MASFNLVDDPWIPCIMATDQSIKELGIRQALLESNNIIEVFHGSPTINLSIHRMLIAILHRVFGPSSLANWEKLRAAGHWDEWRLSQYLDEVHSSFDLFSDQSPIFQDITLREDLVQNRRGINRTVPLAKLARELASTRNATLFDHGVDDSPEEFTPAEAARLLLVDQYFALPDGSGYKTSPMTYGACVLVAGDTFFETLLFNLLPYNAERPQSIPSDLSKDRPWWEYDDSTAPGDGIPHGYLSYLTWPYRRLLLDSISKGPQGSITHVARRAGDGIDKSWTEGVFDPMISYNRFDSTAFKSARLDEDRSLWRNSHSLLSLVRLRGTHEPGFNDLLARSGEGRKTLHVFGVVADQSNVRMWRHEKLPLAPGYLTNDNLIEVLEVALVLADKVAGVLAYATRVLGRTAMEPGASTGGESRLSVLAERKVTEFVKSAGVERYYWSQIEVPFKQFMMNLADEMQDDHSEGEQSLADWALTLRSSASKAFVEATSSMDTSTKNLKALANAERVFVTRIHRTTNEIMTAIQS